MHMYAPKVPTAYPNTATKTATDAKEGWNADATTGAEAAPPTFAILPMAKKKKGALIILPMINNTRMCMVIQINPIMKKYFRASQLLMISKKFISIPMVATRK
jgi:hypothetical protein